jgi:hypothetical protein
MSEKFWYFTHLFVPLRLESRETAHAVLQAETLIIKKNGKNENKETVCTTCDEEPGRPAHGRSRHDVYRMLQR